MSEPSITNKQGFLLQSQRLDCYDCYLPLPLVKGSQGRFLTSCKTSDKEPDLRYKYNIYLGL